MAEREVRTVVSERDVDSLVAAFNGDAKEALRAVMHDLATLVDHFNAAASRGYARRQHGLAVGWGGAVENAPSRR